MVERRPFWGVEARTSFRIREGEAIAHSPWGKDAAESSTSSLKATDGKRRHGGEIDSGMRMGLKSHPDTSEEERRNRCSFERAHGAWGIGALA